ncbi:Na(+)-translocating NADH-quinone reductase subunit C [Halochromatium salexigens]|uniref:Na(+)-translocating NADH-quinone reductase subunit C n=1 Tax=Halochromatium salexigens TaxID=49447 RepID=A0AAJ0XFM8_HALSE|nr:Na(+)-translocating NADH-quinone reductase subunit C [Halochromatium salexigens]MBK5931154.1 Na(+)-translocating NADH-quinone reductase subunit C [Halochromatium salexigens]
MSADSHSQAPSVRAGALLASAKAVFRLPNDDPRKTIAVALVLCLACSVVVSATAVSLRPLQERNAARALKSEVIKVAGIETADMSLDQAFEQIERRLVDLETGEFVEDADPLSYSYRDAAKDPAASSAIEEAERAGLQRRPDRMPVYLVRHAGELQTIILPVYGAGLWSTMHGLLALAPDGRTTQALTFYEQRETAGLGSEVAGQRWLSEWPGKVLIDETGEPVIEVVKGNVDPDAPNAEHRVDGLSGATLTSNGVTNLMHFWLGEQGYGPFLARLRDDHRG